MRVRDICAAAAALVLPAIGLVATAAPAAAEGDLRIADGTLYDGCRSHAITFDLSYPAAAHWEIDGSVYAPGGDWSGGWFDIGDGDSASGRDNWSMCDYEGAGWWYADAIVTWYDDDYNVIDTESLSTEFHVRRQPTWTNVSINDTRPRKGQIVRLRVTSKDLQPRGWTANSYALVAIDARCDGSKWYRVRGSKQYTNVYGRVSGRWRWNVNQQCQVRAVTVRDDNAAKSYSRVKTWRTSKSLGREAPARAGTTSGFIDLH